MLQYSDMYNITAGIFTAFKQNKGKRLLTIRHPKSKRDYMERIFPVNKYSEWTKENFIIAVLYVNFYKSPSSLHSCIEHLRDLNKDNVFRFKNEILNYRKFLQEDIERLKISSEHINQEYMTSQYRNSKIMWYTYYFYMINSGADIESLEKSRINGYLVKKIKNLLLYITFSEKSHTLIRDLLTDVIEI